MIANPALDELLRLLRKTSAAAPFQFIQVDIAWKNAPAESFDLRHADDRDKTAESLKEIPIEGLRPLAQKTIDGVYRPLKAAPTLVTGWRCRAASPADLESALRQIYPGALADWFAARSEPPFTPYRMFAARQTGIYSKLADLDSPAVAAVAAACCAPTACLKRRVWDFDGPLAKTDPGKSVVPCLEPCPILMDAARLAAKKGSSKS